jgi:type IV pilus assembly protein PilC
MTGRNREFEDLEGWAEKVRCSPLELAVTTRVLSVLIKSGVHIAESLKTVSEQTTDPSLVEVWWSVHNHLQRGHRFSAALAKFPRIFSLNYRTLVKVGEESGALPQCLTRIADWLEQELQISQKVQATLTYPVMVLSFSCLLTWWLMAWVLPPFLSVLEGMELTLPWPTRVLMLVVEALNSVWGIASFALLLLVLLRGLHWLRQPHVYEKLTELAYRTPVLGTLVLYTTNIRVAVAGTVLFHTGCDAITSWRTALQAAGNPVMTRQAETLIEALSNGEQASDHFESRPNYFAHVFTQMVRAGEETGRMPQFLEHTANLLEDEVEFRMATLTAALEPVLMALLSLVMLGILLAVFLPLYSHLSSL